MTPQNDPDAEPAGQRPSSDIARARIAILATHGFERSELVFPMAQLTDAGATVHVVAPAEGQIRSWDKDDWGEPVPVDQALGDADAMDYDILVLPGGQINPDLLRVEEEALAFIKAFHREGKTIAAICHAPWLLIECDLVRGRRATSYHSVATDMRNAGADWVDEPVVVDGHMITSRRPDDLEQFVEAIIAAAERS